MSTPGAVFHRLDRDEVVRRLRAHAERELALRPEVREVVLFGSLARGDWSARSDADVVLVVDERKADYPVPRSVGTGVDLFVYTVDEAQGWTPRFRGEVEAGIVLYRRGAG